MDVRMPDLDGIEATRQLARDAPADRGWLMLTMVDDDDSVFAAMRGRGAGATSWKGAGQEEIARAIQAVAAGEAIFGPGIAARMLRFFTQPSPAVEPFPDLTAREREILQLIADGLKQHHDRGAPRPGRQDGRQTTSQASSPNCRWSGRAGGDRSGSGVRTRPAPDR